MVHNALEGIKNTVGENYYDCIIKSRSDMIFSPHYRFKDHLSLICKRANTQHKVLFTDWMQSSIRNMPSKENQFLYHCEDSCFGGNASSMFLMYNNFLEKVKKIENHRTLMLIIHGIHYNTDLNSIPLDLPQLPTNNRPQLWRAVPFMC